MSSDAGDRFGLAVRFDLKPGASAAFDALVAQTLAAIREKEPGTLAYLVHAVVDAPDSRVFYELYRDVSAFDEHERQPHVSRFLAERGQYLIREPVVWRLSPDDGVLRVGDSDR